MFELVYNTCQWRFCQWLSLENILCHLRSELQIVMERIIKLLKDAVYISFFFGNRIHHLRNSRDMRFFWTIRLVIKHAERKLNEDYPTWRGLTDHPLQHVFYFSISVICLSFSNISYLDHVQKFLLVIITTG